MLTRQQKKLLMFINDRLQGDGVAPSFEEMRDALDLKSKSGVHRMVQALVERGFLERLPNRARALEVVRMPNDQQQPAAMAPRQQNGVRPPSFRVAAGGDMRALISLPLYGKIAAGTPIAALADTSQTIDIPVDMLGPGEHYALIVEGDSMKDAGILDRDVVLIKRTHNAHDGDIVVALVDDEEATLKRFARDHGNIVLYPANDAYQPLRLDADRVKVQGQLVGLWRAYRA